jgi:hypothetical protein
MTKEMTMGDYATGMAGISHYRRIEAEDGLLGGVNQLGSSMQHRLVMRSSVTQDAMGH